MADKRVVDIALAKLAVAFPTELTNGLLTVYEEYLADVPDKDLKYAVDEIIVSGRFFPKVSEIREAANQNKMRRERIPCPADAWAEVARQMREKGYYQAPEWSHPLVEEAMRAVGGWTHLTGAGEINMETVRAQYLRIYEAMVNRVKTDMNTLPGTRKWLDEGQPGEITRLEPPKEDGPAQVMGATIQALTGKMTGK